MGKAPLDYASPKRKRLGNSGCAIIAIGTALSWGPVGMFLAWIVGQIGGKLHESGPPGGPPYPDGGIPAFMIGLMAWPVIGILGTVASILLADRADKREVQALNRADQP